MSAQLLELIDGAQSFEDMSPDTGWPHAIDLAALSRVEPERPKFIIDDWLPVGYASLLAGHGGVGKSGIALELSVCIAAGIPFCGMPTARRRVLYLSCEDRESVLHWRLNRICAHNRVDLESLAQWLHIVDLVGRDVVLWERDPRSGNTITPGFNSLTERMERSGCELLVVDGISDTFGGNENARTDVKRYVNSLVSLIPQQSGAVLLVGHISKPSASNASTSEGYSGSTGWHNSVRARWYLYPETERGEESDRPERTGKLLLELQKSNLGRTDQEMHFAWDDTEQLFVGQPAATSHFDRKQQERTERRGILEALKACGNAGTIVPEAMQGPRTAYFVLSQRPEFPDSLKGGGRAKTNRFRRYIEQMRQSCFIASAQYRRNDRHTATKLDITQEGMRECG